MDFSAPHFVLFESTSDPFAIIISQLCKYADCPLERVSVKLGDDIKSLGIPLDKLPALQFDKTTIISGFSPICRSIATRAGLDGSSLKESGEVDMIVSFIESEIEKLRPILSETPIDENKIHAEIDHFLSNLAPFLEVRIQANKELKAVVGKGTTWADFVLIYFLRSLIRYVDEDPTILLENYPSLLDYFNNNKHL